MPETSWKIVKSEKEKLYIEEIFESKQKTGLKYLKFCKKCEKSFNTLELNYCPLCNNRLKLAVVFEGVEDA